MHYFKRPGFAMHYAIVEGALPADTLFLHGNLSANLWWEPAVDEWRRKGGGPGRMILAEWRGCGGSREFSGPFNLPILAEDCLELLDHLEIPQARLVGHSTGGLIGLYAMHTTPERFARAVLLDTVTPKGVPFDEDALALFRCMKAEKDFCASILLSTILGGSLSETYRQRIVDQAWAMHPHLWEGVPLLLRQPSPPLDLARVTTPVLVMHGEFDPVLSPEDAEAFADALPQGRFALLPGRGHCPNVEEPGLFVSLTDSFLFER